MTAKPIHLSGITHQFGKKTVLSDVSAFAEKNKITAILGRSGSGKSTLLQIMNGMIAPVRGDVRVFGQPIDYPNSHKLRQRIGYVVQHIGLFPHMTVSANISILGRTTGMEQTLVSERISHLMEMVQLPESHLKKYPHQLSGGEQQRVGLCRAMFLDPPVILMDEPFASLDYETKRTIHENLLKIQEYEPRTTILVTHDWDEALMLADAFLWMEDGRIKASGDHEALRTLKNELFPQT